MTIELCPKFSPGPWKITGECEWDRQPDRACRYCGSMNPDDFMARIEAGTIALTGTDKSYKVYVHNAGGDGMKQSYRDCPPGSKCTPDDCPHWTTREIEARKFYFEHLSRAQGMRFVELYNLKKVKFTDGGGFYVYPYFMGPVPQHGAESK